ncbi:MAG TPA: RlmE family RNA methyltransferase [Alphaproteobacteria bacterium]|nr:RlmE family RNA methyltransferase [Alphaproteobacteria bacterium]
MTQKKTPGSGSRGLTVRVKTAKSRTVSSARWLERQLNDPYVAEARRRGFRSRAAFKLEQLDDKLRFLKPGGRVVDLGAAPGGWTQVAIARTGADKGRGKVVGIDLLPIEPIADATLIEGDFLAEDAPDKLKALLDGPADVVLSDMAASTVGHARTDHLRIMALAEAAYAFAQEVLAPGGAFVCKLFQGGAQQELQQMLKQDFETVRYVKPPASRAESSETYIVATGYRGGRGL